MNNPSHKANTKLVTMKIWKAKCIVLIHRRQIVSKFSISCSYNQAFLFPKAHNPAVNAPGRSGRKSRRKGVITGRALITTTVSYYSIRNSLFLECVRKIFDNDIQCAMIAVQSPQLNIWCFFWHDKTRLTNYTLTSATWLAARNNGKKDNSNYMHQNTWPLGPNSAKLL